MKTMKTIASFIEKLQMDGSDGYESALLITDMDAIGGSDNSRKCINTTRRACKKSTNGNSCVNQKDNCSDAYNSKRCFSG